MSLPTVSGHKCLHLQTFVVSRNDYGGYQFDIFHKERNFMVYKGQMVYSLVTGKKVKVSLVQALRLCTGRTAHRGSRGIALPFHDHGTRRG